MQAGAQIVLSGIQLVLAGLGIGVLMAAPIGPVNVLVIQRAVSRGFWGGLAAGIGAVLGDGVLAAIGAFSIAAISDVMIAYGDAIQYVGGALLIIFGLALLLARPVLLTPLNEKSHLLEHTGIIPQTFVLTVTNPGAILGMAAMIGGLGSLIGGLNTNLEALILVAAIMGGSLLWWLGLSELIATIRHKLTENRLNLINRIAGTVLFSFGVALMIEGLIRYFR
ncbi:MAG: LysE family translocator [Methyloceanibacter sp.]|uniref:LysE family translocator n=1 Tax=Methyloceanibacter sp. TaxID=1965321 RepID=UPI003D6D4BF0